MDKKKKDFNWFKTILYSFIIVYICLYGLNMSGYYDKGRRDKMEFTSSQIEQFEKDVDAGKTIDLNNYIEENNKDYSNSLSRLGYNVSKTVDTIFNRGIMAVVKFILSFVK